MEGVFVTNDFEKLYRKADSVLKQRLSQWSKALCGEGITKKSFPESKFIMVNSDEGLTAIIIIKDRFALILNGVNNSVSMEQQCFVLSSRLKQLFSNLRIQDKGLYKSVLLEKEIDKALSKNEFKHLPKVTFIKYCTYNSEEQVVAVSNKKEVLNPKRVVAKDEEHLEELIKKAIKKYGNKCDLNFIDVSHVTDMSFMFCNSNFNGDISKWNVSNVTDMSYMFCGSEFNDDISKWNVGHVKNMDSMFESSKFNGDISKWDVSNVTDMNSMFRWSEFNGDVSKWDISKVKYMGNMFQGSKFTGDISKWLPMMKKNRIKSKLGLKIKKDTWNDIEV